MASELPRQHTDAMRQDLEVPEDEHPTVDKPLHGDRRPVAGPVLITAGLIVVILVVMLVMFLL